MITSLLCFQKNINLRNRRTKRIDSICSESTLYNIIEDAYTEKFLPEVKIETIEIDGKKYNKKEVLEKINELKEIK